jgi:GNAT superfamily N-acetyltransferase
MSEFRRRLSNVTRELRWRGPLNFSLLVLRELLSPLMYWHVFHVFEMDVTSHQPVGSSEFDVAVCSGRANSDKLTRELVPMGEISGDEINSRLGSGDSVAVAYAGRDPIGYAWVSFATWLKIAFLTVWVLDAQEAAFYGSFTHPGWRGRGVQRHLDAALMRYLAENGIATVFSTVSAFNRAMLRATNCSQRRKSMTLVLVHVRGINWVYRRAFGAPLQSRFAVSLQEPSHNCPRRREVFMKTDPRVQGERRKVLINERSLSPASVTRPPKPNARPNTK